ncbi:hypothetical protein VTK56DRAFT_2167 [Thermocarpiscus australiensis]
MKPSRLYLALGLAHLSRCAPLDVSDAVDGVATTPRVRPIHIPPRTAPQAVTHDISQSPVVTRPAPPHGQPDPEFRRQISHPESTETSLPTPGHDPMDSLDGINDEDYASEVDAMDPPFAQPSFAQPGMPCQHGRSARERNDMLVVFLAVAFMLVVVMMETWGSVFRRQGVIRLQETTAGRPVLVHSITERSIIGGEKQGLRA